jgi:hypothetical protein
MTHVRTLTVGNTDIPLLANCTNHLILSGLLYECGEEHDLHLNPEADWHLANVELLLQGLMVPPPAADSEPTQNGLKACPFCREHLKKYSEAQGYYHPPKAECPLAGFEMERDGYSEKRWNTRASRQETPSARDDLLAALRSAVGVATALHMATSALLKDATTSAMSIGINKNLPSCAAEIERLRAMATPTKE